MHNEVTWCKHIFPPLQINHTIGAFHVEIELIYIFYNPSNPEGTYDQTISNREENSLNVKKMILKYIYI